MAAIFEICKRHKVRCLVPLNDWEVQKLSRHFKPLGVTVFTPDSSIVDKVRDKGKYRELLNPFNVKAPRSYIRVKKAVEAIENSDDSYM
ncbi:hypothetical protein HXA32_04035 [Salipaludibacillus agaradhaerens]|nr:hypothetical protein [Salipaludibacillus agaradhaerens]MCR6105441.1 hypothetical protein [Salipaludibacillus agaradhaerens]UJW56668.1 hypothetical protein HXZ66_04215 [Bacillus sp. A116_S68]